MGKYFFFAAIVLAGLPFYFAQDGMVTKYTADELIEKGGGMMQEANATLKRGIGRDGFERAVTLYYTAAQDFETAIQMLMPYVSKFTTRDYVENVLRGRQYCLAAAARIRGQVPTGPNGGAQA